MPDFSRLPARDSVRQTLPAILWVLAGGWVLARSRVAWRTSGVRGALISVDTARGAVALGVTIIDSLVLALHLAVRRVTS